VDVLEQMGRELLGKVQQGCFLHWLPDGRPVHVVTAHDFTALMAFLGGLSMPHKAGFETILLFRGEQIVTAATFRDFYVYLMARED
jgi:hypothetical protein